MRINLHARIEIGLATLLLLGSCGVPVSSKDDRIEVTEVNARNALSRVESLESRMQEVETDLKRETSNIEKAFSNAEADRKTANGNAGILNNFKDHTLDRLGRIESRLGMR